MSSHKDNSSKLNRRSFFKKAAAIGLGATVGGSSLGRPGQASAQITIPKEPVSRRPFGRSGIMVSTLSLGGMFDLLNNQLVLAKAFDWGINYWDTAEGYGRGRSEDGIGRIPVVDAPIKSLGEHQLIVQKVEHPAQRKRGDHDA